MFVNFSQVWSLLRLPGWYPSGEHVSSSLWHNHLCLPAQPLPHLCLPGALHRGGQHGSALVHRPCNPPGNLPHSTCSRLLPSRHNFWRRKEMTSWVRLQPLHLVVARIIEVLRYLKVSCLRSCTVCFGIKIWFSCCSSQLRCPMAE